jgi:hypothetical protein
MVVRPISVRNGVVDYLVSLPSGAPFWADAVDRDEHLALHRFIRTGWVLIEGSGPWELVREKATREGQLVLSMRRTG